MVVMMEGAIAFLISSKGAIWKKKLGNPDLQYKLKEYASLFFVTLSPKNKGAFSTLNNY